MQKNYLVLAFFVLFASLLHAQNLEQVKKHITELSSEKYHGRGYVKNGINLAADYIVNEFKRLNVKPIGEDYFQNFTYDINTFPGKMQVVVDGKKLLPGTDFLVGPMTPTTNASYELFVPDSLLLNDTLTFLTTYISGNWKEKMLVIDYAQTQNIDIKKFYIKLLYTNSRFGGILELIPDELLMSVARVQQNFPVIKIKREIFDKNAKQISVDVTAKLEKNFPVKNVIGYIEGKNTNNYIFYSAHYDHLGHLGKKVFIPGAQDNASGVAMVLDLAAYYTENQPECNIVFMLFAGEETGLLGSTYYVNNPLFPFEKIKMGINLDLVGTGDDGLTIVNSAEEEYADVWAVFDAINSENQYFTTMNRRGKANNSDHHPFNTKGVKAVFIYTIGGRTYYHNVKDKIETLTFAGYEKLFGLITKFAQRYE